MTIALLEMCGVVMTGKSRVTSLQNVHRASCKMQHAPTSIVVIPFLKNA
jgi:hypothetical protein